MKKITYGLGLVVLIVITFFIVTTPVYNRYMNYEEDMNKSFGEIQNQLRRQYELIPNMVEAVKGEAKFEQDTFTQVAEARSKAGGQINMDPSKIANDPEAQRKLQEAQNSLSGALSRLLSVQEKYPELKANKGFQDLRAEIAGTANRITRARSNAQSAISNYNREVRNQPGKIVAWMYGFFPKPYYDAGPEAQSGSGLVNFGK